MSYEEIQHFTLLALVGSKNASSLHSPPCYFANVLQFHLQPGSRGSFTEKHFPPLCRCCRRSTAAGRTSAWSTTSTTLPTCASRGSATGSSTGSPSTTRGYVWAPGAAGVGEGCRRGPGWTRPNGCRCVFQSVAVEGYETGEHAPGLRLKGSGAYRAAHHIIKVSLRFASPRVESKQPTEEALNISLHAPGKYPPNPTWPRPSFF